MASTIKVDKIEGSTGSTITVPTGQTLTVTDGIPVASGGTGLASFTQGDILYATGATTLAKLGKGTTRQGLQTNSGVTAPEWTDSPQSLMTAQGDNLYASGANTLAKLAKGSGSDTLKMNSGATAPEWVTVAAASSDCVKVWSSTLSSGAVASIDVTSVFSSTYKVYKAYISGLYWGANQYPQVGYLVGGVAQTSSYYYKGWTMGGDYNADTASSYSGTNTTGNDIFAGWYPNNTDVRGSAELTFYNPNDSTYKQAMSWLCFARYTGIYGGVHGYGFNDSAFAATGFRLTGNSGTIQDGCTISVYGFKY